ncbi:MAG: HD domain-containing protein, partial [Armatimonadia bacterium]|nr:HD domain-containing protein [Armatimonadia bacterium]
ALGRGWELAGRLTAVTDAAVFSLAELAMEESGLAGCPIAIAATGGYGRAELFPCSDVDLAIIPGQAADESVDAFVKSLHRLVFDCLTDGVGLDVGYQFRPSQDLPHVDPTTRTTLLDTRQICGDKAVFTEFRHAVHRAIDPTKTLLEFLDEREERGLNRLGKAFRLEPDLKQDPGGVRDLGFAMWIARIALRSAEPLSLEDLREIIPLEDDRYERIRAAVSGLADLRFALHVAAGRKTDTLYATQWEGVGSLLYQPGDEGVDAMLRLRFASATEISAFAQEVVEFFSEGQSPLGSGLMLTAGKLARVPPGTGGTAAFVRAVGPPQQSLGLASGLEAIRVHARTGAPLKAALRRDIASVAPQVAPATPETTGPFLREIIDSPGAASGLRLLRDLGWLHRLVPEVADGIGAPPYDPSHEHAICEHTLRVIENLFALGEEGQDVLAAMARLWRELSEADRRAIILGALLHDMGKPDSPRDHSTAGAEICRAVGERLGMDEDAVALAARLIELHLEMAHRSRTLDLDQDITIRTFVEMVGDARTLNLLYLLTYADTKAVGLGVFGDVERRLLDDLYARTLAVLAEEGMDELDLQAAAKRVTERAVTELHVPGASDDRIREHCEEMPPLYVVATPLPLIGMHIAMVRDLTQRDEPVIDFYTSPGEGFTELTVCCYDAPEPGLFARISACLFALGLNVHAAQIRTRQGRRPVVLDTLMIDYRGDAVPLDVQERTAKILTDVLLGRTSAEELLIQRGRTLPATVTLESLSVRNDMSDEHTVAWITAEDKSGLLYRLARALTVCGLNLHTAKITTWGASAHNVFYVTQEGLGKVPEDELEQLADRLREAIRDVPEALLRDRSEPGRDR